MTTTDTFCCQAATDLESAKSLLRLLTYEHRSGIGADDCAQGCVYCGWQHQDYRAEPKHKAGCPIRRAREWLWPGDAPYPWERGQG